MSELEFRGTKGDWKFEKGKFNTTAQEHTHSSGSVKGEYFVCSIFDDLESKEEATANAKLIASAPVLLEALQDCVETIEWLVENGNVNQKLLETFCNIATNSLDISNEAINKALK